MYISVKVSIYISRYHRKQWESMEGPQNVQPYSLAKFWVRQAQIWRRHSGGNHTLLTSRWGTGRQTVLHAWYCHLCLFQYHVFDFLREAIWLQWQTLPAVAHHDDQHFYNWFPIEWTRGVFSMDAKATGTEVYRCLNTLDTRLKRSRTGKTDLDKCDGGKCKN